MESNLLTDVFLPLALFIIMLGMGLTLTRQDFARVLLAPKATLIGLAAQLVMLPIIGFLIAWGFPVSPEIAVGVVLLTACPGGPTSNLITFLAKGDVALSITLTAITSIATVFTIPLIVNLGMQAFLSEDTSFQLPFLSTVGQIIVITIIPVSIGMMIQHYAPQFANRCDKPLRWISTAFLALIITGVVLGERENFFSFLFQVGGVTLAVNIITMGLGFFIGTVAGLGQKRTTAITVEVGIQNGTLAITIASTIINNATMAIPAAIYSLLMFLTGGGFAWLMNYYGYGTSQNHL
ncbi:bile acid:sodium symporter family protein [Euhalothece natronophila Z-M001]|uniref:Bile acid:sodium symporter family protein n=1 Tax=Euhalothece natronophila Z-M001 TaxID=522448 RepID=A0A5B8NKR9_9CHRO|nr:bile acid:sodium symporter family protein [Euhalothece natronophila]QDZ38709.1 bile acid:sodium symporter family protein [Euhalothece natronophila Z-M001]